MARSTQHLIVYGIHPVEEALNNGYPKPINLVVRESAVPNLGAVILLARQKGVPVEVLPNPEFMRRDRSRHSQGLFLITEPFKYGDINNAQITPNTVMLALDLVQDPQNLGSLLRSAAFFGVSGVILPKDRSVQVTPAVIQASAGGIAHVPVFKVTNLARTLRELKDRGMWIIGADSNEGQAPTRLDLPRPVLLVLGSEGNGLRKNVKQVCDILVRIPSNTGFDSLNVAVAGAILMYAFSVVR